MECPICIGDLMKDPATDSAAEPPAKKLKTEGPAGPVEPNIVCLPCGHFFHNACLAKWLTEETEKREQRRRERHGDRRDRHRHGQRPLKGTCPVCRDRVREDELYPAYPIPLNDGIDKDHSDNEDSEEEEERNDNSDVEEEDVEEDLDDEDEPEDDE